MDITFNCRCGQSLSIDQRAAGSMVQCPKCLEQIVVPATVSRPADNWNLTNCPDCGRQVSRRAASCPHCGAPLGAEGNRPSPRAPVYQPPKHRLHNEEDDLTTSQKIKVSVLWVFAVLTMLVAITFAINGTDAHVPRWISIPIVLGGWWVFVKAAQAIGYKPMMGIGWALLLITFVIAMGEVLNQTDKTTSGQSGSASIHSGGYEGAVKEFMAAWVTNNPYAAAKMMDSRAVTEMKDTVEALLLHRFDGEITSYGDNTWTKHETGEQYPVKVFMVTPVADFGGTYMAVPIEISVAKDSFKVFAIKPHLPKL